MLNEKNMAKFVAKKYISNCVDNAVDLHLLWFFTHHDNWGNFCSEPKICNTGIFWPFLYTILPVIEDLLYDITGSRNNMHIIWWHLFWKWMNKTIWMMYTHLINLDSQWMRNDYELYVLYYMFKLFTFQK